MSDQVLLEARGISKNFGGVVALDTVDFTVRRREIVGLIGPNGSGKTTLFNCLTRVQKADAGTVVFDGEDVTHARPYELARRGMARTFQRIRVYPKLSVLENMLLSRQWRGATLFEQLRSVDSGLEMRAHGLLEFLTIDGLCDEFAGTLSGGQQRLLEIGMALMPDPKMVLLDEATSGVNPTLIETIKDRIRRLNDQEEHTFLLIEHDMRFISDLCERVVVLDSGRQLAEGSPGEITQNQDVIDAYFGA